VQIGFLAEILEFMGGSGHRASDDRDTLIERRLKAYTTGEPSERLPTATWWLKSAATGSGWRPRHHLHRRHAVFRGGRGAGACHATLEKRVRDRTEELTRLNSELALAKSTAEDANISKTRFLAAASHDILQPLNAARLYVTSLVERQNGGEDSRLVEKTSTNRWRRSRKSSARCWIFRGSMPAHDARDHELQDGRPDALAGNRVCAERARQGARADFRALLAAGRIRPVDAAPAAANFISNAIKYTPQGRVLVGCRRRGQSLQIGVHDTGVGIPCSSAREIFKEFHRLEQGARIARGLGLGLSIVERLARVLDPRHCDRCQRERRLGVFGDGADGRGRQPHRSRHQRDAAGANPDQRRARRLHRERSGNPGRHEDAVDGMERRSDRAGPIRMPRWGRSRRRADR